MLYCATLAKYISKILALARSDPKKLTLRVSLYFKITKELLDLGQVSCFL